MQLTIRGLPPEIEEGVRREASERGISLNRAVIRLLERALGRGKKDEPPSIHQDLDRFSGVWSKDEAAEMTARFESVRNTDEELWI